MSLRDLLRQLPPAALVPVAWVVERLDAAEPAPAQSAAPAAPYTVEELAERLGRAPSTIRGWIGAGELEAFKLGREWRIPPASVEALFARKAAAQRQAEQGPKGPDVPADLREAGRKGGLVRASQTRRRDEPFAGTILDVMDAAGLEGATWVPWRAFWRAVFALPMSAQELEVYRRHTERDAPPAEPVREAWMPIGRRGGKTRNAAIAALFLAVRFDATRLAPGELAVIPLLAADRRQARQVLGYLRGLFDLLEFKPFVHRQLKEAIELHTGVNIEVHTASYRTTRGYTCLGVVCDEISFWRTDDGAANPDAEVLTALRPGMATVPDSLLLALSSPYAAKGELYTASERYFGQEDPQVLVWNADSASMNPSVPAHVIERAFEEDPVSAASEYGTDGRVQFRRDVESFLDPEAVRAVTVTGRRELEPREGVRYVGFVDPSGGSQDSMTLAVAHAETDHAVLDCVREVRPPFSPDGVAEDFAAVLHSYGVSRVVGDRYGGEWPRERFARHGITYEPSERTKSDIYREFVAPVNAGSVALLDLPVLRAQLIGLERRVARGGKDSIDHAPGGRDDVANAAAGALGLVAPRHVTAPRVWWPGMEEDMREENMRQADEPAAGLVPFHVRGSGYAGV